MKLFKKLEIFKSQIGSISLEYVVVTSLAVGLAAAGVGIIKKIIDKKIDEITTELKVKIDTD